MGWLGLCPNHPIFGSLLRARGFFITLLELQPETSPARSLWDKACISGPHWAIRSRGTALSGALRRVPSQGFGPEGTFRPRL